MKIERTEAEETELEEPEPAPELAQDIPEDLLDQKPFDPAGGS